jgi:hypothetical protein
MSKTFAVGDVVIVARGKYRGRTGTVAEVVREPGERPVVVVRFSNRKHRDYGPVSLVHLPAELPELGQTAQTTGNGENSALPVPGGSSEDPGDDRIGPVGPPDAATSPTTPPPP